MSMGPNSLSLRNPFNALENTLQSRVQPTGNRIMLPNNQMARLGNMAPLTQAYRGAQLRGPVAAMTGAAMGAAPAAPMPPQMPPTLAMEPALAAPAIPMPTMRPAAPARPSELLDSGAGFTTLRLSDGTVQRREGDRGSRNNNPGNLTGSDKAVAKYGAIARDHGGNLIFATPELGQIAMNRFILDENGDKTVAEMLETYAPGPKRNPVTGALEPVENDPFDTNKTYPAQLAAMGINLNQTIDTMTEAQKRALVGAMRGVEGNKGYTVAGERGGILGGDEGGFGLLADPRATGAVELASGAAATAEARIDQGKAKPLSAAERRRFGPENLGMIAFGLSLLGGEDVTTAMNNGLNVYSMFEGMDDAKEQQDAIDAAIGQLPPEQQELARALAETNPDLFSQNIAQRLSGGSGLSTLTQGLVEQGILTAEEAREIALLEQVNPQAAVEEVGKKREASNAAFAFDTDYSRVVTEKTRQLEGFATTALQKIDEIIAVLPGEGGQLTSSIASLLERAGPSGNLAKQLEGLLQPARANVAFNTLQAMREASKTGGALGNVSNVELNLLMGTQGNLGMEQGLLQLRDTLASLVENAQISRANIQQAYAERYAARGVAPYEAAPATGDPMFVDEAGNEVLGVE